MTGRVTIRPYDPATDADVLRRAAPRLYPGPTAAPRDPQQFAAFFERLGRDEVEIAPNMERFVALDENGEAAALLALHQDHDHFVGYPRAYVDIVVVEAVSPGR